MLSKEYVLEGYNLMMDYIIENRIKTKNRNFVRRLENFYNKNKDKDLEGKDELKYLNLELEFYNTVCIPCNNNEKALLEFLKITLLKGKKLGEME